VASPAPPAAEARPITRRPLFWAVVGGGVAAAVTVVLLLALSGERDPSPTIGRGVGN
jgi:hypothetical protein